MVKERPFGTAKRKPGSGNSLNPFYQKCSQNERLWQTDCMKKKKITKAKTKTAKSKKKTTRREDVNQAAARTVRQATER
jgi:hypothetical protein